MCQAYRCICIHLQPWQPGHCCCRAGSGRCRSLWGTALWPCEGRVSSPQHTEPLSPALTPAAAAKRCSVAVLLFNKDPGIWIQHGFIVQSANFSLPHRLFCDVRKCSNRLSPVWEHFPVPFGIRELHALQCCDMLDASSKHVHFIHRIAGGSIYFENVCQEIGWFRNGMDLIG